MELCYFFQRQGKPDSQEAAHITRIQREKDALSDAVAEWIRLFDSDVRPALETHDTGTEIIIHDTCSVASEMSLTLCGLESVVYRSCENGSRPDRLCEEFLQNGIARSEAEDIIDSLLARHLLVSLGNHLIALGVPKPLAEIPRFPQYPYGSIDRVLYAALLAARRITAVH